MKTRQAMGYTLLELLVTISIMAVLATISMTSFASPNFLLQAEGKKSEISQLLAKAQLNPILSGQKLEVSFTNLAVWLNDNKRMVFDADTGWRWETDIGKVIFLTDGSLTMINARGLSVDTPQTVFLTYNQKHVLRLDFNPKTQSVQVVNDSSATAKAL